MLQYQQPQQQQQQQQQQQLLQQEQHQQLQQQQQHQQLLQQQLPQQRRQTYKEYLQQHQQQKQQLQQQQPLRIFRVHYIRLNSKDGVPSINQQVNGYPNGSPNGAKMKTIAPNIRRRRRCDKHHLELYCNETTTPPTSVPGSSSSSNQLKPGGLRIRECITAPSTAASSPVDEHMYIPAPPITPPPAFLTEGYKRSSTSVSTSALPSATSSQETQTHGQSHTHNHGRSQNQSQNLNLNQNLNQSHLQSLKPNLMRQQKPFPVVAKPLGPQKPRTTATIAVTLNSGSNKPRATVKRSLGEHPLPLPKKHSQKIGKVY
uniref:Signal transducer and activator of transcription C n=1 Tax=Drosophila rhopaloa TaxID=1041015 RepID=A0A6P4FRR5_DRORH